jgi:hypothetical protein
MDKTTAALAASKRTLLNYRRIRWAFAASHGPQPATGGFPYFRKEQAQ